jgi:hypothetical protein
MEANYGGTQMRAALEFSLKRRDSSMATAAFVLTDGEVCFHLLFIKKKAQIDVAS